jgi:hypothetical protein
MTSIGRVSTLWKVPASDGEPEPPLQLQPDNSVATAIDKDITCFITHELRAKGTKKNNTMTKINKKNCASD